jgi:hypothetical protein
MSDILVFVFGLFGGLVYWLIAYHWSTRRWERRKAFVALPFVVLSLPILLYVIAKAVLFWEAFFVIALPGWLFIGFCIPGVLLAATLFRHGGDDRNRSGPRPM